MTMRFLPVRLTLPLPGVENNWPELLLPQSMDSEAWQRMIDLLEVMRPGVVIRADRKHLMERFATAIRAKVEASGGYPKEAVA